jgi:hypothetical protein
VNYAQAPTLDYFGTQRKTNGSVDIGAVEFVGAAAAVANVTGGPLAFGSVVDGTTSAAQTATLHNTGGATLTGITVTVTGTGFVHPAGTAGGTCGATLAAGANCTINVTFSPTAPGAVTGSLTIGGSVAVAGSPVTLTGTGVAPTITAALTPTTWTTSAARGSGPFTALQFFFLQNTGNVTLTGIGQGALGGTNASEFTVDRAFSTCGPAGGGQMLGQTTLAPGASCAIAVSFTPKTTQTTGLKTATLSVTDLAGTQTSSLSGTAN